MDVPAAHHSTTPLLSQQGGAVGVVVGGPSAAMEDGAPSGLDLLSQLAATIKSQAAAMEAMAAKIKVPGE